jgi:hypothetical protein
MAKFDLTSRMGQYLDRHLIFPLLEFLSAKQVSGFKTQSLRGKCEVLCSNAVITTLLPCSDFVIGGMDGQIDKYIST